MQLLVFILVYPIIWLLSILPMRVLYFISDGIYILLYYVIGYRKKVVRNNLLLAFPEKSEMERLDIEKKSFRHFVDIFVEMIKSFTISKKEISKRFTYKNLETIDEFYNNNKSLIIMAMHYANWEWVISISLHKLVQHKFYVAYRKIDNKYFNEKMKASRSKFNGIMISTSKLLDLIHKNDKNSKLSIYGLLSDQSPLLKKTHYWSDFMGVNVPIHTGAEMLAKKYNYPVLYLHVERVKRGYYESTIEILAEHPREFEDYEITDLFLQRIEKQIRKNPEYYFWTHNRFKHMGKEKIGR
jgi:KDO2-lipid IV(A) lauroyltransferase